MRLFLLSLSLVIGLVFAGCAKPWSNPAIKDSKEASRQFDRDSVACEVVSGEQYPVEKRKQDAAFAKCMEDKGWVQPDGQGMEVNFRK